LGLVGREIAVIGAGVGGLAAATALGRRGAQVTVFERAPALREVGAGLQIGPNAVAVLEALGLRDAVAAVAATPPAVELRDFADGRLVARLPLGATAEARYGRPYWQAHRADLLDALAGGAAAAGVALRLAAPVASVEDRGASVTLTLEDGGRAEAEAAVGADGLRSGLRAALFGGAPPRFAGHVAWRALAPAERLGPAGGPPATCVFMGPGRHLVCYPLRGGAVWNLVAVEARDAWAAEDWSAPADPAALRAAFAGWAAPARRLLEAARDVHLWGLFDHPPLPAWTRGRVALLGDACHPMTPFLAQGAAMAIEDGWTLAACLAAEAEPAHGLAAYEARRRARVERVRRAAARNARLYHLATPGLRAAVHLGLRAASRLAPEALLGRFDWLYGADLTGPHPTGRESLAAGAAG
jgi:salicylate hydroxylase